MGSTRENIQVSCRIRPPNQMELDHQSTRALHLSDKTNCSIEDVERVGAGPQSFTFDHIFDHDTSQKDVFALTAGGLIPDVFAGYNTTIFAYGQTGSGKTHTMMGQPATEHAGIIPRLVHEIFKGIDEADPQIEFTVKVSFVEIYNERLRDLLDGNKQNLKIREGNRGVWIEDVTERYVSTNEQVLDVMAVGAANRAMASTNMNLESSRSHSVMIITLGQHNKSNGSKKGSKLILVDLAGSEKVGKTGAQGQTLKEAQNINKSLSALGNVINSLTAGKSKHIPYRDSKLTKLLSDSLGGNSKTCLIITVSPMSFNAAETISTLRFGTRAKEIKNKPRVNAEKSVEEYKALLADAERQIRDQQALIRALEKDVGELKACLGAVDPKNLKLPMPTLSADKVAKEIAQRSVAEAAVVRDPLGDTNTALTPLTTPEKLNTTLTAPITPLTSTGGVLTSTISFTSSSASASASASSASTSSSSANGHGTPTSPSQANGGGGGDDEDNDDDAFDRMTSPMGDEDLPTAKQPLFAPPVGGDDSKSPSSATSPSFTTPKPGRRSSGSEMLRAVNNAESQSIHLINAQLKKKLTELQKENMDLKEQLQDKVNDEENKTKESNGIGNGGGGNTHNGKSSGDSSSAVSASAQARKEEQAERARDEASEAQKQTITMLTQQVDVLTAKQALLEKEHNLTIKRMADEKRELELKLGTAAASAAPTSASASSSSSTSSQPAANTKSSSSSSSAPASAAASSTANSKVDLSASVLASLGGGGGGGGSRPVSEQDLVAALQNKCDQYVNLQIHHQTRKEHLVLVEKALETANGELKTQQHQSQTRIRMLEDKLRTAEDLCEKLLESGLYWRRQRQKERERVSNIVVPIQGGGKAAQGGKKATATATTNAKPRASMGSSSVVPVARPKSNQGNSMDIFF